MLSSPSAWTRPSSSSASRLRIHRQLRPGVPNRGHPCLLHTHYKTPRERFLSGSSAPSAGKASTGCWSSNSLSSSASLTSSSLTTTDMPYRSLGHQTLLAMRRAPPRINDPDPGPTTTNEQAGRPIPRVPARGMNWSDGSLGTRFRSFRRDRRQGSQVRPDTIHLGARQGNPSSDDLLVYLTQGNRVPE